MCLGAIYWARLERIYYACAAKDAAEAGFDDTFIYDELKKDASLRKIPTTQIAREAALPVFAAWRRQSDKIAY